MPISLSSGSLRCWSARIAGMSNSSAPRRTSWDIIAAVEPHAADRRERHCSERTTFRTRLVGLMPDGPQLSRTG